jgi:hypothetical protein
MTATGLERAWSSLRYDRLLPRAGASFAAGARYARVVAAAELVLDARRRRAAIERIARWQGVARAAALRVYRASLESEAREEADTTFFARHPERLAAWLAPAAPPPPPSAARVFATLHFGSPVLIYAYLRVVRGLDVRAIARSLDAANPMPDAKRRWGERKLRWLDGVAGVPFYGTDPLSIARAREHLVDGRPLYAAVDVPGDVVARAARVELYGETLSFSAGIFALARIAGATILPALATRSDEGLHACYGREVDARRPDAIAAVFHELAGFVHERPEEWWLWAYLCRG